jgi:hypothetical protein
MIVRFGLNYLPTDTFQWFIETPLIFKQRVLRRKPISLATVIMYVLFGFAKGTCLFEPIGR